MNENDKKTYLQSILLVLKSRIQDWTVFEVLQFLDLIHCQQFNDIVRKNKINGAILTNKSKLDKILIPTINETNFLVYLKMVMIINEIYCSNQYMVPVQQEKKHYRPHSMMINEKLLKIIQIKMEKIFQKQLIFWNNDKIISLLNQLEYNKFTETIKKSNCDGFILICVTSDRENLINLKKFLKQEEIREIIYISQILVASNFFLRYSTNHQEQQIKGEPQQVSLNVEIKKHESQQSGQDEDNQKKILEKSASKIYQQNSFFLAYDDSIKQSMKKKSEPSISDFEVVSIHSSLLSNQAQIQNRENRRDTFRKNKSSNTDVVQIKKQGVQNGGNISSLTNIVHQKNKNIQKQQEIIPQQQTQKNQLAQSQYAESHYDRSQYAQSHYAESQYAQSQYAESQYGNSQIQNIEQNYSIYKSTEQSVQSSENLMISSIEQPSKFLQLQKVTLNLPFDLLSFQNLHEITFIEINDHSKQQLQNKFYRKKNFSIKGVRFGRDKINNYSYPDELSISSNHAMIFFRDEKFYLQDLGSKTGTFKQIKKKIEIYDDICIQLSYEVQFTIKILKRDTQGIIKLIFSKPQTMPTNKVCIKNNVKFTIGRSERCNIKIDDKKMSISMKHAQIHYEDFKFYFVDMSSQNGSWIRLSEKGRKSDPVVLEKGDKFRISSKKVFMVEQIK